MAAAFSLLTGCGSGMASTSVVRAPPARNPPTVTQAERAAAASASTALGLDVFRLLAAGNGNVVMSPASLDTALAMLFPAARGATAAAIARVLHDRLPGGTAPAGGAGRTGSAASGDQAAMSAGTLAAAVGALQRAAPGKRVTLREADSVWTQRGAEPAAAYLRLLAAAFRDGVHETDFRTDPSGARNAINAAVAKQTDGIISDLFPAGTIDSRTVLALVNAIYLHAMWRYPFDPDETANRPFHLLSGQSASVPAMTGEDGDIGYAAGPGWQAAQLPYQGGNLAMDIVLPTGSFTAFRQKLTAPGLNAIFGRLTPEAVGLRLPKFTLTSDEVLNATLARLGMGTAFGPTADFGGLGIAGASVRTVVQDAYIQVAEKGTTAAAATGIAVGISARRPPVTMAVDRPFLFAVRNIHTGQILFLGQVTDP